MDPITTTIAVAKVVGATLRVLQTCNEYYEKYQDANLQLVCMQTQCSIIEVALLQIQDVIVNDASRFDRLQSVSVLASNYERNLGACQTVFAILNHRLDKLHGGLRDNAGKPGWRAKLKVVWNEQESAMLLKNIEGQALAIGLLLNAIQMKRQDDLVGLLTRKESKKILKTASDDAVTLMSADKDSHLMKTSDEGSVTSTAIDDMEFDFDFEVINTAAYRKVFNAARRKLLTDDKDKSPAPSLPSLPEISQTEPLHHYDMILSNTRSQVPVATRSPRIDILEPQSGENTSRHIQLEPETQNKAPQDRLQPPLTMKLGHISGHSVPFGDYLLGRTISEGQKSTVKLARAKDDFNQVVIKLFSRPPLVVPDGPSRVAKIYREVNILRQLRHSYVVQLHEIVETEKHIGIVLDYVSSGDLETYVRFSRRGYFQDPAARKLLAQVVSGVGYLHQKGVLHLALSCKKVLLDRNWNAVITGFSHANTYDPEDKLSYEVLDNLSQKDFIEKYKLDRRDLKGHLRGDLTLDRLEEPYFSAPEAAESRLYKGRKADVWSIGVINYFMLAGEVPWADMPEDPEGADNQKRISYIVATPIAFPAYVSPHARDLLRRVLEPDPARRVDLYEIARHSWLSEYHHVVASVVAE